MKLIVQKNEHQWEAVKERGAVKPKYTITLKTPAGGYFPDYIVEFLQDVHNQEGEVYPRAINYPAEDWTPAKIAKAIEENQSPTTEYICQPAEDFYNNRSKGDEDGTSA